MPKFLFRTIVSHSEFRKIIIAKNREEAIEKIRQSFLMNLSPEEIGKKITPLSECCNAEIQKSLSSGAICSHCNGMVTEEGERYFAVLEE